ncbi:hypothetical protein ALC57_06906 [Trachymyrmex cornetzi]|uniref:Uncharacterized protein n=1 Tax=Trachymyrmex cornetzi TaxID=471704 RepID=A0A195E732_9HYME|nr:hypothetical protein ALC57_06906 [Trachymyrmex cornetzi]
MLKDARCLWHHSRDLGRICVEEKRRIEEEGRKESETRNRLQVACACCLPLRTTSSQAEFATARLFVNRLVSDKKSSQENSIVVYSAMCLTGGRRDHCANLKPKTERKREREKGLANKTACHGGEWGDLARRSQIACVPRRAPWDD